MRRRTAKLGFPRRVVACYLLFSTVAVTWLAGSLFYTAHSVLKTRAVDACLARLERTAAAVEMRYLRHGRDELRPALSGAGDSPDVIACAVVSSDGEVLAHSGPGAHGVTAPQRDGSRLRWGGVAETRFVDGEGRSVSQFRLPLTAVDDHFGTLHMTVRRAGAADTLRHVARIAPVAIAAPLCLVAVGAVVLARWTAPLAAVEGQLRNVAQQRPGAQLSLGRLRANHAAAIGWNRVVEALESPGKRGEDGDPHRRLAAAARARQQNELNDVLQNLTEGIVVTDLEGRVTFANRAIAGLLDVDTSDEELRCLELQGVLLQGAAQDDGATGESTHKPLVTEISRGTGDAARRLRLARAPLCGERARGHVWSVRDVTQQKLAERMRDQFIDAATHELRTPLSNIKAYAETLATCEAIEVEQQKEFCNIINSEVTRLARFVDDLLSISSMESGSLTIERQNTDAARMFGEVVAKVQPLMKQKDIDFDVKLPEKMNELNLDKDKVVAVLVNLLGNAAKYTPRGGSVAMRVHLDASLLQVTVQDTGVGIAEDEVPKVFDKFFRSADLRVQAESGTGLGLSLAREVVRMHGGDITVESKPDQGATFVTTIPVE